MKKRKKEIYILLCVGLLCAFMVGCGKKEKNIKNEKIEIQNEKEEIMEKKRLTKEDLMKEYNISEEELEGVDVISFLSFYADDLKNSDEAYVHDILQFFKEEFNDKGYMNYGYMLNGQINVKITRDNFNDIERIVWQLNSGEEAEAIAFDFQNKRIYEGGRIDSFDKNNLVGNADEEIKQKVIQVIEKYKIYDWQDYYQGGSTEGTTANYNWQMAIEFSNGTLWKTGGDGLGDEAYPENMEDFIAALRKCEPENVSDCE